MEPQKQVSYYRVLNRFSKVFTLPSQRISKRHLHRPAFRKVLFRLAVDLNAKACTGQLHNCRCPSQLCKMRRCFHLCNCSLPNANSKFDSLTFPVLPIHVHANRNPFTHRKETCGATSTAIQISAILLRNEFLCKTSVSKNCCMVGNVNCLLRTSKNRLNDITSTCKGCPSQTIPPVHILRVV